MSALTAQRQHFHPMAWTEHRAPGSKDFQRSNWDLSAPVPKPKITRALRGSGSAKNPPGKTPSRPGTASKTSKSPAGSRPGTASKKGKGGAAATVATPVGPVIPPLDLSTFVEPSHVGHMIACEQRVACEQVKDTMAACGLVVPLATLERALVAPVLTLRAEHRTLLPRPWSG